MHFIKNFVLPIVLAALAGAGLAAVTWARDASITIVPSSTTFLPGDTITYTVTVNNESGDELTGVTHEFTLENSDASVTGSTLPAGPQTILADGSVSYEATVQIPADFSATWLNVEARLLASDGDTLARENERINLFTPFLSVTKTATAEAPRAGAVAYTITARNTGFAPATNVIIVDTLPLNLTNVVVPADLGCTFNAGPRTVTCDPISLAANEQKVVSFVAAVSATATCNAILTNNVVVSADNASNASAKADTKIICPTPTPKPTPSTTPTPTPTSSPAATTGGTSGGGGSGSSSGSSSESSPATTGQVKAARATGSSSADKNAPDFILFKNAPLVVDQIFFQVFSRKPQITESAYWKGRARSDKATASKLRGAMQFYKSKGRTYPVSARKKITIADIFHAVYGRNPSVSELTYWRKRAVKKNMSSVLSGAMLFHKLNNIKH